MKMFKKHLTYTNIALPYNTSTNEERLRTRMRDTGNIQIPITATFPAAEAHRTLVNAELLERKRWELETGRISCIDVPQLPIPEDWEKYCQNQCIEQGLEKLARRRSDRPGTHAKTIPVFLVQKIHGDGGQHPITNLTEYQQSTLPELMGHWGIVATSQILHSEKSNHLLSGAESAYCVAHALAFQNLIPYTITKLICVEDDERLIEKLMKSSAKLVYTTSEKFSNDALLPRSIVEVRNSNSLEIMAYRKHESHFLDGEYTRKLWPADAQALIALSGSHTDLFHKKLEDLFGMARAEIRHYGTYRLFDDAYSALTLNHREQLGKTFMYLNSSEMFFAQFDLSSNKFDTRCIPSNKQPAPPDFPLLEINRLWECGKKGEAILREVEQVCLLWRAQMANYAFTFDSKLITDAFQQENISQLIEHSGELLNMKPLIDAFFAGVPVEDIIS